MAEIRVLKTYSTFSVSGRATIQYAVGADETGEIYFAIRGSNGGFYDARWIAWSAVNELLDTLPEEFTTIPFAKLFTGRSANNCGYMGAILVSEKVIVRNKGRQRKYQVGDPKIFLAKAARLQSSRRSTSKTSTRRTKSR